MNPEKIRAIDTSELQTKDRELQEQMFRLRFQMAMGQTEGVKKYRESRKDRARILTVLRERELKAKKG
ncbi:MAG: 50S ribosomal protein L29 [Bryobacteraceae bacterium]|nr:50S ribosomal protein L29 [Bryobacteraceae bacterium]